MPYKKNFHNFATLHQTHLTSQWWISEWLYHYQHVVILAHAHVPSALFECVDEISLGSHKHGWLTKILQIRSSGLNSIKLHHSVTCKYMFFCCCELMRMEWKIWMAKCMHSSATDKKRNDLWYSGQEMAGFDEPCNSGFQAVIISKANRPSYCTNNTACTDFLTSWYGGQQGPPTPTILDTTYCNAQLWKRC